MLTSQAWFSIIMLVLWIIIAISQCRSHHRPDKTETTKYIDLELKRLALKNKDLRVKISDLESKLNGSKHQIDSLTKLKQKIKYVYIDKIHSVDTMGFGSLLREFRIILAKPNQK